MEKTQKKYIVRTDRAGVFYGEVVSRKGNTEITMANVRKIWYWDGACAVEELALSGTFKPDECKLTVTVPEMVLASPIQVIPCSKKAQAVLDGIKEWKRG